MRSAPGEIGPGGERGEGAGFGAQLGHQGAGPVDARGHQRGPDRPTLGDPVAGEPAPVRVVRGSDAYRFVTTVRRELPAQIEGLRVAAGGADCPS
ncbi:hypothetical protein [Actinoplanes sp. N902-109]|uniref:hypothetical protein n=1 Tax=Actinoplanes sp. (strain N902-109) TaxID=649831 RepID=UPI00059FA70C|nr:hypothetical protein [Actinoplanes sp. N902-109]